MTGNEAEDTRLAIWSALQLDAENYWCENDGADKASYLAGAARALAFERARVEVEASPAGPDEDGDLTPTPVQEAAKDYALRHEGDYDTKILAFAEGAAWALASPAEMRLRAALEQARRNLAEASTAAYRGIVEADEALRETLADPVEPVEGETRSASQTHEATEEGQG